MARTGNNAARPRELGQRTERRSPCSVPATGLRTMRGTIFRTLPRNSCGEMPPIVPSMPWPGAAATPGSLPGHGDCTFLVDPADDPLVLPACWRADNSPFVLRIDSPQGGIRINGTTVQRDIAVGEVRYLVLRGSFGAHRVELAVTDPCAAPSVALGLDASLMARLGCLEALASGKPDVPLRLRPTPCQAGRRSGIRPDPDMKRRRSCVVLECVLMVEKEWNACLFRRRSWYQVCRCRIT